MRIASPPTRHSCFYGVDTPERAKLLAAQMNVAEMNRLYRRRQPRLRLDRRPLPRDRRGRPRRGRAAALRRLLHRRLSDQPHRPGGSGARNQLGARGRTRGLMPGAFAGQAGAGHRREPRHRRGDRRGAGGGGRACRPDRADRAPSWRRSRSGSTPPAASATIAPLDLTETGQHRQAGAGGGGALAGARHARAQRGDARHADPGRADRRQGVQPAADPQPARPAGADRGVRSAAAQERGGAADRDDLERRPRRRALIGAPMARPRRRSRRWCWPMARRCRTSPPIKVAIVDPGATATAMRARAYPGEDPATLKPPGAVAEAVVGC